MTRSKINYLSALLFFIALTATAAQFKFGDQTFTVPDGFEVELVASTNLVSRPVSVSFDEQGRLYVTDSSGSNEKVELQLANPNHRVLRLEDTDGDGKFDKSVVFADKMMFTKYPSTVQTSGSALVALLNVDEAKQRAHLEELLATLPRGDIRGGQAVFNSTKAACAACHQIGYLGGKVGPDLTSIGKVRTERDLLEAIVYPSASFVRSYEPIMVMTKSGEDYSGVLSKDAPDEIVLATGPNAEVRVLRSDITEMRIGQVSAMPSGLDGQLTKQVLADLVAFLKAAK